MDSPLDYDVKKLDSGIVEKGKGILSLLPATMVESTPSGGQHWVYWSKKKPKINSLYLKTCGIEILGENKLIIMAPSNGYSKLNDSEATVVDDLEALFIDA